jgi:hypothetical protein
MTEDTGQILKTDFAGRKLCANCWNGAHWIWKTTPAGKRTGARFANCLAGDCECGCIQLLAEYQNRHKKKAGS